jgi:hypothetical protein
MACTLHEDMRTFVIILYLAEFFLKWGMFQTKGVEKMEKKPILCSIYIPPLPKKSYHLWDNVEKYCTARQATEDNIIRRMRCVYRITKPTDTNSEYVTLIAFPGNAGYANAPQCYVKSTLPVWLLPNFPPNIFIAEKRSPVVLVRYKFLRNAAT